VSPPVKARAPFDSCVPATFSGTSGLGHATDRTALWSGTPYALGGGGGGV
jgi:hypothetical protein